MFDRGQTIEPTDVIFFSNRPIESSYVAPTLLHTVFAFACSVCGIHIMYVAASTGLERKQHGPGAARCCTSTYTDHGDSPTVLSGFTRGTHLLCGSGACEKYRPTKSDTTQASPAARSHCCLLQQTPFSSYRKSRSKFNY